MSETKPHSGPIKSQSLRASRMPASAAVSYSGEPTCSLDKEGALGLCSGLCFLGALHKASPSLLHGPGTSPSSSHDALCTVYLPSGALLCNCFIFFAVTLNARTHRNLIERLAIPLIAFIFILALKFTTVLRSRHLAKGECSEVGRTL